MLESIIVAFHLLTAICIIGLVLLQQGKGAEAGASFGAGASATVFGSTGSATFFSKVTAILAAIFFITSLGLGYFAKNHAREIGSLGLPDASVIESMQDVQSLDIPTFDQQDTKINEEQKDVNSGGDVPVINDDIPQIDNQTEAASTDAKELPNL